MSDPTKINAHLKGVISTPESEQFCEAFPQSKVEVPSSGDIFLQETKNALVHVYKSVSKLFSRSEPLSGQDHSEELFSLEKQFSNAKTSAERYFIAGQLSALEFEAGDGGKSLEWEAITRANANDLKYGDKLIEADDMALDGDYRKAAENYKAVGLAMEEDAEDDPEMAFPREILGERHRATLAAGIISYGQQFGELSTANKFEKAVEIREKAFDCADDLYRLDPTEENVGMVVSTYASLGVDIKALRDLTRESSDDDGQSVSDLVKRAYAITGSDNDLDITAKNHATSALMDRMRDSLEIGARSLIAEAKDRVARLIESVHSDDQFTVNVHLSQFSMLTGDEPAALRHLEVARDIFKRTDAKVAGKIKDAEVTVLHRIYQVALLDTELKRDVLREAEILIEQIPDENRQKPMLKIENMQFMAEQNVKDVENAVREKRISEEDYYPLVRDQYVDLENFCAKTFATHKGDEVGKMAAKYLAETQVKLLEMDLGDAKTKYFAGDKDEAASKASWAITRYAGNRKAMYEELDQPDYHEEVGRSLLAKADYYFITGQIDTAVATLKDVAKYYSESSAAKLVFSDDFWTAKYGIVENGKFSSNLNKPAFTAGLKTALATLAEEKGRGLAACGVGTVALVVLSKISKIPLATGAAATACFSGYLVDRALLLSESINSISASYRTGISNYTAEEAARSAGLFAFNLVGMYFGGMAGGLAQKAWMAGGSRLGLAAARVGIIRGPWTRAIFQVGLKESGFVVNAGVFHDVSSKISDPAGDTPRSWHDYFQSWLFVRIMPAIIEKDPGAVFVEGEGRLAKATKFGINTVVASWGVQLGISASTWDANHFLDKVAKLSIEMPFIHLGNKSLGWSMPIPGVKELSKILDKFTEKNLTEADKILVAKLTHKLVVEETAKALDKIAPTSEQKPTDQMTEIASAIVEAYESATAIYHDAEEMLTLRTLERIVDVSHGLVNEAKMSLIEAVSMAGKVVLNGGLAETPARERIAPVVARLNERLANVAKAEKTQSEAATAEIEKEVRGIVVGGAESPTDVYRKIAEGQGLPLDVWLGRVLRLASTEEVERVLGESGLSVEEQINVIRRDRIINARGVLERALQDDDENVRRIAAEVLGELGDTAAMPTLTEALRTKVLAIIKNGAATDRAILEKLAEAHSVPYDVWLGRMLKNAGTVEELEEIFERLKINVQEQVSLIDKNEILLGRKILEKALKDEDEIARRSAVSILDKWGDRAARPALEEALKENADTDVRISSAIVLGRLRDRAARLALEEALSGDPDGTVRRCAAAALGELGDKDAQPALKEALKDADGSVRGFAAVALRKLEDSKVAPQSVVNRISVLKIRLKDGDPNVRSDAARTLGELRDKSARNDLEETLKAPETVSFVRRSVIEALGELDDKDARLALEEVLSRDPDEFVRSDAAEALGKLKDKDARRALAEALKDPEVGVRRKAAKALGQLGDKGASPALKVVIRDRVELVRTAAVLALDKLDPGWDADIRAEAGKAFRIIDEVATEKPSDDVVATSADVDALAGRLPKRTEGKDTDSNGDAIPPEVVEHLRRLIPGVEGLTRVGPTVEAMQGVTSAILARIPAYLVGETGTGKNSILRYLAHLTGTPLYRINFGYETDDAQLYGHLTIRTVEEGGKIVNRVVVEDGKMLEAMKYGGWAIWDEANLARESYLVSQNGNVETIGEQIGKGEVSVMVGGEVRKIKVHKDFRLFATGNPSSEADRGETEASFGSRWLKVVVPSFLPEHQTPILKDTHKAISEESADSIPRVLEELKTKLGRGAITVRTTKRVAKRIVEAEAKGEALWERDGSGNLQLTEAGMRAYAEALEAEVLDGLEPEEYDSTVNRLNDILPRGARDVRDHLKKDVSEEEFRAKVAEYKAVVAKLALPELGRASSATTAIATKDLVSVPTTRRLAMKVLDSFMRGDYLIIEGLPAQSKTAVAKWIGKLTGQEVIEITGSPDTTVADLIGKKTIRPNGKGGTEVVFIEGPVLQAMKGGAILIINEANLIRPRIMERLNSLFDDDRALLVTENGATEPVKAKPPFQLVLTQNPHSMRSGRRKQSDALSNKLRKIRSEDFKPEELVEIVKATDSPIANVAEPIVEAYEAAREIYRAEGSDLTLRALERLGDIATALGRTKLMTPAEAIIEGARIIFQGQLESREARERMAPVIDRLREKVVVAEQAKPKESATEDAAEFAEIETRVREVLAGGAANLGEVYEAIAERQGLPLNVWLGRVLKDASAEEVERVLGESGLSVGEQIEVIRRDRIINARGILERALLQQSGDVYVRRYAAQALEKLGDKAAIPVLKKALLDDDVFVRINVAKALGKLDDKAGIPALKEALLDEEVDVRVSAAEAFGELGAKAGIPALKKALLDEHELVRFSVAIALGKLSAKALREALLDKNVSVRTKAAIALGKLGAKAAIAIPELKKALRDKYAPVRFSAAEALGKLRDQAGIPALKGMLLDGNAYIRLKAAEALGKLGDKATIPVLEKALREDKDKNVRHNAAKALDSISPGWDAEICEHGARALQAIAKVGNEDIASHADAEAGDVDALAGRLPKRAEGKDTDSNGDAIPPEVVEHLRRLVPGVEGLTRVGPTAEAMQGVMSAILARIPAYLVGETGTGKNSILRYLAHLTGTPLYRINFGYETDDSQLYGHLTIRTVEEGGKMVNRVVVEEGKMIEAMRYGGWAIWDEANLARESYLVSQNGNVETIGEQIGKGEVSVMVGGEVRKIKVHKDFRLFATGNPSSEADRGETEASFGSRWLKVVVPSFLPEHQTKILQDIHGKEISEESADSIPKVLEELKTKLGRGAITVRTTKRVAKRIVEAEETAKQKGEALWERDESGNLQLTEAGMKAYAEALEAEVLDGLEPEEYDSTVNRLNEILPRGTRDVKDHLKKDVSEEEFRAKVAEYKAVVAKLALPNSDSGRASSATTEITTKDLVSVPTTRRLAMKVLDSFMRGDYLIIEGLPAQSKTAVAKWIGKLTGQEVIEIPGSPDTTIADLIGKKTMRPDGKGGTEFVFIEGPVLQAMKRGAILIINEANLIRPRIMERLNSLFDDDRALLVTENGATEPVKARAPFQLILTQNPHSMRSGRRKQSDALSNKLRKINSEDFKPEELVEIVKAQDSQIAQVAEPIIEAYQAARDIYRGEGSDLTLRALERLGDIATALGQTKLMTPAEAIVEGARIVFRNQLESGEARERMAPVIDKLRDKVKDAEIKMPVEDGVGEFAEIETRVREILAGGAANLGEVYEAIAERQGLPLNVWLGRVLKDAPVEDVERVLGESGLSVGEQATLIKDHKIINGREILERALLADSNEAVRQWAAEILGELGDASARPALERALEVDGDEHVRQKAAEALGRLGEGESFSALEKALIGDKDPNVQLHAVRALGKLVDAEDVRLALEKALEDPNEYIRLQAAESLGKLRNPAAITALITELLDVDVDVFGDVDGIEWTSRRWAAKALGKLGDLEDVRLALEKALEDPNELVRLAAAESLGNSAALTTLRTMLLDENMGIRQGAAGALGRLGDVEGVRLALEKALQEDEDHNVRSSAAGALGELGNVAARPALERALQVEYEDEGVRHAAAVALGKLDGVEGARLVLEKELRGWDGHFMQSGAAERLGELGDKAAIPALEEALRKNKNEHVLQHKNVRQSAAKALDNLAPGWDAKIREHGARALQAIAKVRNEDIASHADAEAGDVDALAERLPKRGLGEVDADAAEFAEIERETREILAGGAATPADVYRKIAEGQGLSLNVWLGRVLKDAPVEDVERVLGESSLSVEEQVTLIRDHKIINGRVILERALKDEESKVRVIAATTLGELGDKASKPALKEALRGGDGRTHVSAARALGKLNDKVVAISALEKALRDGNATVRIRAAEALGELGDPAAIPVLEKELLTRNVYIRIIAVEALGELGRLGDKATIPALKEALRDGSVEVRIKAAEALGKLRDKATILVLEEALKDEDETVRIRVAEDLAELRDPVAIPVLEKALRDENKSAFEHIVAAEALGKLNDPAAMPVLKKALQDKDALVRLRAAEALGNLGDVSARPALEEALRKDKNEEVRHSAALALDKLAQGWDADIRERGLRALQAIDRVRGKAVSEHIAEQGDEVDTLAEKLPKRTEGKDTGSDGNDIPAEVVEHLRRLVPGVEGLTRVGPTVEAMQGVMSAILARIPAYLVGETGTGKNSILRYLAHLTGTPLYRINFGYETDDSQLYGHLTVRAVEENGKTVNRVVVEEGKMIEAMRYGGWAIWDEANLAREGYLVSQNDVVEQIRSGEVYVMVGGEVRKIKVHKDFRLFATGNPSSEADRGETEASFGSRWLKVVVPQFLPEHQTPILKDTHKAISEESADSIPKVLEELKTKLGRGAITVRTTKRVAKRIVEAEQKEEALWERDESGNLQLTEAGMKAYAEAIEAEVLDGIEPEEYESTVNRLNDILPRGTRNVRDHLKKDVSEEEFRAKVEEYKAVVAKLALPNSDFGRASSATTAIATKDLVSVPTTRRLAMKVLDSFMRGDYLMIEGLPAQSKTAVAKWIGKLTGQEVIEITGSPDTTVAHLIGKKTIRPNGKGGTEVVFIEGPVLQAMKRGAILIINEANLIRPRIMERLNSLFDDDRALLVTENGATEPVHAKPPFQLILTQNPHSMRSGRRKQSDALSNKLRKIRVREGFTTDELTAITRARLAGSSGSSSIDPPPPAGTPSSTSGRASSEGGLKSSATSRASSATTGADVVAKLALPNSDSGRASSATTATHNIPPAGERAVEGGMNMIRGMNTVFGRTEHGREVAEAQGVVDEANRIMREFKEQHESAMRDAASHVARDYIRIEIDMSGKVDFAAMDMEKRTMYVNPLAIREMTPEQITAIALHEGSHASITRLGDKFFFKKRSLHLLANAVEDPRVNEYALARLPGARQGFKLLYDKLFPDPRKIADAAARGEIPPVGGLPHEQFAIGMINLWANGRVTERITDSEIREALNGLEGTLREIWATRPQLYDPTNREIDAKQNEVFERIKTEILPIYEKFYKESLEQVKKQLKESGKPQKGAGGRGGSIDAEDLDAESRAILEKRAGEMADKLEPQNIPPQRRDQIGRARAQGDREDAAQGKGQVGGKASYKESDFRPYDKKTWNDVMAERRDRKAKQETFYFNNPFARFFDPVKSTAKKLVEGLNLILKLSTDMEYEGHHDSGDKLDERKAIETLIKNEAGIFDDEDLKLFLQRRIPTKSSHAFVLVLDESGSMKGAEVQESALSAMALFRYVMDELSVSDAVVGFADIANVHKTFEEGSSSIKERNRLMDTLETSGGGGTNDLEGLKVANDLLAGKAADEKTIIVVTDGQGVEETKAYVKELEAKGIRVIAIGIGPEGSVSVADVYTDFYQSSDFSELPRVLMKLLVKRMTRGRR